MILYPVANAMPVVDNALPTVTDIRTIELAIGALSLIMQAKSKIGLDVSKPIFALSDKQKKSKLRQKIAERHWNKSAPVPNRCLRSAHRIFQPR